MRATLILAGLVLASPAAAIPPPVPLVIQHSGRVLGPNDQGVEGALTIVFTLYKDPERPHNGEDTIYWTESRTVQAFKGVYAVALGDTFDGGTALVPGMFGDGTEERWLGIKVGDDPEMAPRLRIGSVPYALRAWFAAESGRASSAGTADVADDLECVGCVGAGDIAAGALSASQIAAGAIGADQIASGAVARAHLADDAVGSEELAESAVLSAHLGPKSVQRAHLADAAVGLGQIDDDAVGGDQIAEGAVTGAHIAAGTITLDRLAGRDANTGLVTGLNAEKLGGKTAAEIAAMADPSAAIAAALTTFAGVQRPCNNGAGVQTFDGAAWGACLNLRWNCSVAPGHAGCVSSSQYGSCDDIQADDNFNGSNGLYWIDPDGSGSGSPFQVFCDMTTDGGGWTLLMKAAGTDYPFENSVWTTTNLDNTSSLNETFVSAKFQSFNSLQVQELLIKAQSGSRTLLRLPSRNTPLSFFQGNTTILTYVSGSATMSELINGKTWSWCGEKWRINTFATSRQAKIRLGGWVTQTWDCNYGNDNAGQPTGAHLLGFGIRDNEWCPCTTNGKSFGIRDAHDQNNLNPGQLASAALLYGR
jgi:hypothetical protein